MHQKIFRPIDKNISMLPNFIILFFELLLEKNRKEAFLYFLTGLVDKLVV